MHSAKEQVDDWLDHASKDDLESMILWIQNQSVECKVLMYQYITSHPRKK